MAASLQSMAELDEISRVQSHFSPHFLLIFLIYLARALAILCKLGCYCIQPWVSLLLSKSIFRRNLTMPWSFFKFSCFLVVLFISNSFALNVVNVALSVVNVMRNINSALFNLHFVWIIITLIILNNFKLFPPKSICVPRLTKITSYEVCFCSRHAGINGKR